MAWRQYLIKELVRLRTSKLPICNMNIDFDDNFLAMESNLKKSYLYGGQSDQFSYLSPPLKNLMTFLLDSSTYMKIDPYLYISDLLEDEDCDKQICPLEQDGDTQMKPEAGLPEDLLDCQPMPKYESCPIPNFTSPFARESTNYQPSTPIHPSSPLDSIEYELINTATANFGESEVKFCVTSSNSANLTHSSDTYPQSKKLKLMPEEEAIPILPASDGVKLMIHPVLPYSSWSSGSVQEAVINFVSMSMTNEFVPPPPTPMLNGEKPQAHFSGTTDSDLSRSPDSSTTNADNPRPTSKYNAKFNCTFCGKPNRDQSTRLVHERIHTGEKPYKCSFFPACKRMFTQNAHMHKHVWHRHTPKPNKQMKRTNKTSKQNNKK